MVDAQAIDAPAPREARNERMRGREHLGVLGPQAGEVGDLEKPAVIDLVRGDAPVSEPVMLLLEKPVQRQAVFGWLPEIPC